MEFILIKIDSSEWNYMWNWLATHPLNKDLQDPATALNGDESWQYMGSWKHKDHVIHSFRHRNHPTTESIHSVSVKCSDGFTPDQIHNEYKV